MIMIKLVKVLVWLVLLNAPASSTSGDMNTSTKLEHESASSLVLSITVDDAITPFMADYIKSALTAAAQEKVQALLINLDTPGGLYDATREIVQAMLASPIPIIVYVSPAGARAGSAGVFIAMAAHILAMAPSTNIGAAHPVDISGEDVKGDMKQKITNDAKAWARSIAETRGKNADWAEKSVVGSESISAIKAMELNVIDFIADDEKDLLAKAHTKQIRQHGSIIKLNLTNAKVVSYPMSARQKVMKFLSNPNLIYILLLLGILGIFIEFQSPGLILPGLLGVVCLAVVFGVQILPINWFGALLILAAAAFFIAEIFVVSFGLLAIGGLILLITGSYLLFSPGAGLYVEPLIIWLFSGGFTAIILAIGFVLLKARRKGATSNVDALVGQEGIVKEAIHPPASGMVLLHGSYWQAFGDEPIEKDDLVVVKKIDSVKIWVSKKTKD